MRVFRVQWKISHRLQSDDILVVEVLRCKSFTYVDLSEFVSGLSSVRGRLCDYLDLTLGAVGT